MSGGPRLKPGFRIGASFKARFDDQGVLLATLGKRVTVWNVGERQRIGTCPALAHAASVDFSPDRSHLVAKNTLGDVMVVETAGLQEVARFSGRPYGEGSEIRYSPDGRLLVDGSWSGGLLVRDASTGDVVWSEPGAGVTEIFCTRRRDLWAYIAGDVFVRRWPFSEFPATRVTADYGDAVAVTEDHEFLAVASSTSVRIHAVGPGRTGDKLLAELDDLPISGTHTAVAWHPTGDVLAFTGRGWAHVCDRSLGELHREALPYPSGTEFSPDGSLLALGDWSRGVVVAWPDRQGVSPARRDDIVFAFIDFSPDEEWADLADEDGLVRYAMAARSNHAASMRMAFELMGDDFGYDPAAATWVTDPAGLPSDPLTVELYEECRIRLVHEPIVSVDPMPLPPRTT